MSSKFKYRSKQGELLDAAGIPTNALEKNLRELDFLNRTSGGHLASLSGIKKLLNGKRSKNDVYHITDLGCGSGDALKQMAKWARKNRIRFQLTGVDKKPQVIRYMKLHCRKYPEIQGIASDYKDFLNRIQKTDIIHCALFCHHLSDDEIVSLLKKMKEIASVGFIINDLQRNPLAYFSAKIMTGALNGTYLSKHDGPVSVLRGFKQNELEKLLKKAGIEKYAIYRKPFFRFLVTGETSE